MQQRILGASLFLLGSIAAAVVIAAFITGNIGSPF
jgi:hypothetical protein